MPLSSIIFDETGFELQGERNGVIVWYTPKGDGLGLFHYPIPPDIKADINNLDSLRAFYRQGVRKSGLGVIEIDRVVIDGCTAVRTLFKAAPQTTGRTYLGSLTFPYRDFSYVLRVQCEHVGTTGIRESVVTAQLLNSGAIAIDTELKMMRGWCDDPYDPNEIGPMTRNKSERREYDSLFPDHPLSRARWVLDHLERTVTVDATVKRQPAFN